ncbi:hypothetical protein ABFX02_14G229600 [Erythranthe guttata]
MMWGGVVEHVQNTWPFSALVYNDLRASDSIVRRLPIPESTKHFVYAIRDPDSHSVIYVLSVQNLSERSASDAESLIREIKPDAVIVQVGPLNNSDFSGSGSGSSKGGSFDNGGVLNEDSVPTSVFEVLKNCFVHKIGPEKYKDVAGSLVLREIFGVSFDGHFLAAKKAAEEVGSSFLMLESPIVKCRTTVEDDGGCCDSDSSGNGFRSAFNLQLTTSFVPSRIVYSRPFHVEDGVQSQMVKLLSPYLVRSNPFSKSKGEEGDLQLQYNYDAPQFARSVYPLLVDLHNIFVDIPSMGTALACAQKMLSDVNKGEVIGNRHLTEIYSFQIAVELLRIAFNNAGRITKNNPDSVRPEFSDLPIEEQSQAILAQALRSQTKKYKSIVAVVDASGLAGLRKHWHTNVPPEVNDMFDHLGTNSEEGEVSTHSTRKRLLLTDKPVVAVGAGATAIVGASALSKVVPASTFIKVATFYMPASLKLMLAQTQKAVLFAFGKTVGVGPAKMAASGSKAVASAEKIRAVAQGVIYSAEKTSLSAMRSSFYEIMRKRSVRPVGALPWVTFGCSIATCSGLLVFEDGIECAAESLPSAPSIASLGRGVRSFYEASQVARQAERSRIQKSIEALLHKCKNLKIQ